MQRVTPRAYRAAEGGERACNCIAGEMFGGERACSCIAGEMFSGERACNCIAGEM